MLTGTLARPQDLLPGTTNSRETKARRSMTARFGACESAASMATAASVTSASATRSREPGGMARIELRNSRSGCEIADQLTETSTTRNATETRQMAKNA